MLQKCLRGKNKTPKQQYTADPPKALGIPLSCSIWEHKGLELMAAKTYPSRVVLIMVAGF